jgi:Family of unknown function (DUF5996)
MTPLPELDPSSITGTRDALHAYSRVLGAWLKAYRPRRKHWWHASLRPSLAGLTSGPVRAIDVELELDLEHSVLTCTTLACGPRDIPLVGQSAVAVADEIESFLTDVADPPRVSHDPGRCEGYRAEVARELGRTFRFVAAALEKFRAEIPEETSPIQLWPHHFDLAMLWLPGDEVPGQDPADEEQSDQQMNFGFTFGDHGTAEPYFYVTAYPEPDGLPAITLPDGARWHHEDFSGAVLHYRTLVGQSDPRACLLDFWTRVLAAGRELMQVGSRASRS